MAHRRPPKAEPRPTSGTVATAALIPLRIFLGGTFLYAGLDKLLDPRFLSTSGPGSIGEQLQGFAHLSPLAFLLNAIAIPHPILIGLGMAVLEIAIGLGALTGWLFRFSAAAGAAVSLLFWLTASWSITPYFYGPDIPYAAGWITLALAGTGGAWTLSEWFQSDEPRRRPGFDRRGAAPEPVSESRRRFLELAGVASATFLIAGPSLLIGRIAALGQHQTAAGTGTGTTGGATTPTPGAIGAATSTPAAQATSAPAGNGFLLASGSQLNSNRSVTVYDPNLGEPVIVIKLKSGKVVAYDAVCTHAGCTVAYDPPSGIIYCPCHGAEFDPTHNAQVIGGPAPRPLAPVAIKVNGSNGNVTASA